MRGLKSNRMPVRRARPSHDAAHFPLPHPLDFDWRFTPETIALIWTIVRDFAGPDGGVALLGAPSLARAADLDLRVGPVTLLERNPLHCSSLNPHADFVQCDVLRDPIERGKHSIAIADPPWYEPETIGFLWAAAHLCRVDGHVAVSLPPVSTRPGIQQERERIRCAAAQFGLEFLYICEGVLRYRTPFFETNAMQAARAAITHDWRGGDLGVFRRTRRSPGPRPAVADDHHWIERSVGLTRFRLKQKQPAAFASPVLQSLIPGDILPSVSRRDQRRRHADVWTSGNRIFGCKGTAALASVIEAVAQGQAPEEAVARRLRRALTVGEASLVEHAARQIRDVVKWESAEFRRSGCIPGSIPKLGPVRDRPASLYRAG